ncbi:MAG TPA: RNA methyltransferase [Acidimicrobiales bacterium]|nr:RNA methyltransferase [Acidimicrobiales bacterium]
MQRLRRLWGRRSARVDERCFVVEGAKVLGEALDAGVAVESVYLAPGAGAPELAVAARAADRGSRVFELAPQALERAIGTVTPQPVVAVVPFVDRALAAIGRPQLVVVCVDVRDPGNAGTVLRSAAAAGADAVVVCDGAVDPYNPKAVRASAGALFHVPVVVAGPPAAALAELGALGLARLGTVARGGADYTTVDLAAPTALVLGNEAQGLPGGLDDHLDGTVTIPMPGRAESLNVGMTAAVLCFEAARQRRVAAGVGSG